MNFYKECLGGELVCQTSGDSPLSRNLPSRMQRYILHSTLTRGGLVLMGSDMVGTQGLSRGNAVSLLLQCSSEKEVRACYERLAREGNATHPLEKTFWGALFGDLTDRYGNHWLLNFEKPNLN